MKKIKSYQHRIDTNQTEIVDGLRQLGYSVAITSALGDGFPDLVVARNKINIMLEVKNGFLPPSHRRLTAEEAIFKENWKGQLDMVNSLDEAIVICNSIIAKNKQK